MRKTLFVLAWLSLGCGGKPPAEPIVLGLLAPRSGPSQQVGLAMEQGVLLAIAEAKDQPIQGRPVEVVLVDTAGDPATTFHQAVRLVTLNRAAGLLGGPDVESAEKLCRVGETYQLPVLTLAWLPPEGLGPFGFSVTATPADRGKALAQFAVKPDQALAIATDSRDPAGPPLAAAFVANVKQVVLQTLYGDDLAAAAQQVRSAKPAALLVAGRADQLPAWRREVPLPILFGGALHDRPPAGEDMLYWTTPLVATDPAAKVFAARFESEHGRPPTAAAALAYDAARLWIESARKAELLQGVKVRDQLKSWTGFPSSTGPLAIDGDHAARRPVYVLESKAGADRLLGHLSEQAGKR